MSPNRRAGDDPGETPRRRASDRRHGERRTRERRASDTALVATWDEQRSQFITRYLFAALGLAYFNFGETTARSAEYLVAINLIHVVYITLTTAFLLHARRRVTSPLRLRLAMLTDIVGVSAAVYVDPSMTAPPYLVYVVIILGNGMRYGLRAFAESAVGSFVCATVVFGLRFEDYSQNLSVASLFFILFLCIIVLYAYALLTNIDRARRELQVASSKDALTGLFNRRGLHERAEALFKTLAAGNRSLAVLFADLDGFKAVNDIHGHSAGDRVLREVGRAIGANVRPTDIVARFGGDEFVVLMPDTELEHAAKVAKRLQEAVAVVNEDHPLRLSLTIGMGIAPQDGADLDAVLKAVDAAMYQGKLLGGGIRRADGAAVA